jgi:phage gpG-like protein
MNIDIKLVGDRELNMYLNRTMDGIKKEINSGLKDIADHLKDKVQEKFGTYHSSWPKLKRASVIAKYRRRGRLKGMPSRGPIRAVIGADDPLVLFGKLKGSIEKEINYGAKEAVVYSDAEHAAVHEYGYAPKGVPSRSYMRVTLWEETDEIVKIIDSKIDKLI